jgi:hypothetical protein
MTVNLKLLTAEIASIQIGGSSTASLQSPSCDGVLESFRSIWDALMLAPREAVTL